MATQTISLSKAEKSYIQSSLLSDPPLRLDGRSPEDYRLIALETGVAPLANGSGRVCIGRSGRGGDTEEAGGAGGGTEVVVGVKLEVDDVGEEDDGGKVVCTVSCSPAAYPSLSSNQLDDIQSDLTALLGSVLSHPSLRLVISWVARVDAVVFADGGNVVDCLMLACRAALWDTKVPRTRGVEYRAPGKSGAGGGAEGEEGMDVDVQGGRSALESRDVSRVTDFELTDYWDEGEVLDVRDAWPVCVTLNVLPSMHFLDATLQEEASVPLRIHVMYAFPNGKPILQTARLVGTGTSDMNQIRGLIKHAEKYARNVWAGLEAKLNEEEARRGIKAREKFYGRRR
ncbi:ribosomal protein S5 domain 2-type protein [Melanogaster broomeanus]|nr:ribosomal protein S5 domain 2-type protein [Melanogaster broomeanus]